MSAQAQKFEIFEKKSSLCVSVVPVMEYLMCKLNLKNENFLSLTEFLN